MVPSLQIVVQIVEAECTDCIEMKKQIEEKRTAVHEQQKNKVAFAVRKSSASEYQKYLSCKTRRSKKGPSCKSTSCNNDKPRLRSCRQRLF